MSISETELANVHSRLAAAYGQQAWGAALGVGSFLTVEFGPELPSPKPDRRGHGQFHLWVYCSAWRIETKDEIVACSEDPREHLEDAVRRLDGLTLSGVRVERPSLSAAFEFSDGTTLRTFSIFTKEYDHWMFYLPDGAVFTAGPGTAASWSEI